MELLNAEKDIVNEELSLKAVKKRRLNIEGGVFDFVKENMQN